MVICIFILLSYKQSFLWHIRIITDYTYWKRTSCSPLLPSWANERLCALGVGAQLFKLSNPVDRQTREKGPNCDSSPSLALIINQDLGFAWSVGQNTAGESHLLINWSLWSSSSRCQICEDVFKYIRFPKFSYYPSLSFSSSFSSLPFLCSPFPLSSSSHSSPVQCSSPSQEGSRQVRMVSDAGTFHRSPPARPWLMFVHCVINPTRPQQTNPQLNIVPWVQCVVYGKDIK